MLCSRMAGYSLMGTFTKPKLIVPDHIALAISRVYPRRAMATSLSSGAPGQAGKGWKTGGRRAEGEVVGLDAGRSGGDGSPGSAAVPSLVEGVPASARR